jgi:hemerythrin HHE cation binding domain-containing protein
MPKSAKSIDAIALLKADHRTVEALFEKFEKATRKDQKKKIADQICTELVIHATIEEEIFYPACQGKIGEDISEEAYVEHDGAKMLIAEIAASSPEDDFYDAKVHVLSEEIKHHVKEEEQRDGMFAQAKSADLDLEELGQRLAARKAALKREIEANGLPTPETRSLIGAKLKRGKPLEVQA